MEKEEIISKIKKYVQEVCKNDSTGHDWWHIERVYNSIVAKKYERRNFN